MLHTGCQPEQTHFNYVAFGLIIKVSRSLMIRFVAMSLELRWMLGVLTLGTSLIAAEEPGLQVTSDNQIHSHPTPRLFLESNESIIPNTMPASTIDWSGKLSVLRSGDYRFYASHGNLFLNGMEVQEGPIRLDAVDHKFELHQPVSPGSSLLSVEWEGPGFSREPIPAWLFSHESLEPGRPDGRKLYEDLGCSNCHLSDSPSIQKRSGPILTDIGDQSNQVWIRHWLSEPKSFRSWATMPRMLSSSQRTDVATFLVTQKTRPLQEPRFFKSHVELGRTRFQSYGCVACHGTLLPLNGLGSKTTVGHLQRYLLDPLEFSPDGRMPSFHLSEEEALTLAAYLIDSKNELFKEPVQNGDATAGRRLVQSSGCLACHQIDGLESTHQAPRLELLKKNLGCLANDVPARLPQYSLSDPDRGALQRFIAEYQNAPDTTSSPVFDLTRRLSQLRCNACHELNGKPATGSIAESTPPITGIGSKLNVGWLEHVINSETRILDWQELRMPSYGTDHAQWLAKALAKASGVNPSETNPSPKNLHPEASHDRLGVDGAQGGLGCIGCHGWDRFPALGEDGPNLYSAGQRLRYNWFLRWMRNPARILPNASMPAFFSSMDPDKSKTIIDELWNAFLSAPDLPPPAGFQSITASLGSEEMPVPDDKAIVIRWDMPEATPAAIAVGLPGKISYCFDAGESRLRYAWQGGFIDTSSVLFAKKNRETNLTETARILGDIFFREGRFPIRVQDRDLIPQRRFLGYKIVDTFPEFHYQVDGIDVYERILPVEHGIVRKFRVASVEQPMWFIPAENPGVQIHSNLNQFKIPLGKDVSFEVSVVAGD